MPPPWASAWLRHYGYFCPPDEWRLNPRAHPSPRFKWIAIRMWPTPPKLPAQQANSLQLLLPSSPRILYRQNQHPPQDCPQCPRRRLILLRQILRWKPRISGEKALPKSLPAAPGRRIRLALLNHKRPSRRNRRPSLLSPRRLMLPRQLLLQEREFHPSKLAWRRARL